MADYINLKNAPIVEALVDFRVKPGAGLDVQKLSTIAESLKERYPNKKEIRQFLAQIRIGEGDAPAQSSTQTPVGYRLESKDSRFVLQAQLTGFTLSRLKPYETWESLIDEARFTWEAYVKVAGPSSIARVAVRYINRVEIPLAALGNFEDFLTGGPNVPEDLPQGVAEFLSRVVIRDPETDAAIIITQALEPENAANGTLPVILDIDVFKPAEFPVESEVYWELLDKFRVLKNKVFFSSLTPKALELFK